MREKKGGGGGGGEHTTTDGRGFALRVVMPQPTLSCRFAVSERVPAAGGNESEGELRFERQTTSPHAMLLLLLQRPAGERRAAATISGDRGKIGHSVCRSISKSD